MKMIWGYPGLIDGYGEDLVIFYHDDFFLSRVNRSGVVFTDIPNPRPHQYWKSPQEAEVMYLIANDVGIYDVTRENMNDIGLVQLYDIEGKQQTYFTVSYQLF